MQEVLRSGAQRSGADLAAALATGMLGAAAFAALVAALAVAGGRGRIAADGGASPG